MVEAVSISARALALKAQTPETCTHVLLAALVTWPAHPRCHTPCPAVACPRSVLLRPGLATGEGLAAALVPLLLAQPPLQQPQPVAQHMAKH